MADQDKELINRLADTQLPSRRETEPVEPREPREPSETPSVRETPVPRETEPARTPAVKEADTVEINGKRYTKEEILALETTARQLPHLQKKYTEVLERDRQAPVQPQEPQITYEQIAQIFDPQAEQLLNGLTQMGLIEADLKELYPRGIKTMIGQMRYLNELIEDVRRAVSMIIDRVAELKTKDTTQTVVSAFTGALDKLQGKKGFEILADAKVRLGFIEYLADLDPGGKRVFSDNGQDFLERQWFAYNREAIEEAAKGGKREPVRTDKRLVAGDGSSGRPPIAPRGEKGPMDRMIDSKLGAAH